MDWIICRFCRKNFPAKDYKNHVQTVHKNGSGSTTTSSPDKTEGLCKSSSTKSIDSISKASPSKRYRIDESLPSSSSSVRSGNSVSGDIDEDSDDESLVIAIPSTAAEKAPNGLRAEGIGIHTLLPVVGVVSTLGVSSKDVSSELEKSKSASSSFNRDDFRKGSNVAHVAPTKKPETAESDRIQNLLETSSTCSEASTLVINMTPTTASRSDPGGAAGKSFSCNPADFVPSSTTHGENDTEEVYEGNVLGEGSSSRPGRTLSVPSFSSHSTIPIEQEQHPSCSEDVSAKNEKSGRTSQLTPPLVITETRRIDIIPSRNTRYMCHICGMDALFLTGAGLAAHMKSHDVIVRYTFACSVCREQFSTKLARDDHLAIHREDCSDEIEVIEEIPKGCSTIRVNYKKGASTQPSSSKNRSNNPTVIDIDNDPGDW